MRIYSVQKDISFKSKFVRNPLVQATSDIVKKSNEANGNSLPGGLLNIGTKTIQKSQDLFIKTTTEIETEAHKILENHPLYDKILGILGNSDNESQKSKLEFLKFIKDMTMSEEDLGYMLRLL